MIKIHYTLISIILFCKAGWCGPFDPTPKVKHSSIPNHLEPISVSDSDFYKLNSQQKKLVNTHSICWVLVSGSEGVFSLDISLDNSRQYLIGLKSYNPKTETEEKYKQSPIPQNLALDLILIWKKLVMETKYSEGDYRGLGGFTCRFGTERFCGEIWSPDNGVPFEIFTVVYQLRGLVLKPQNRDQIISKCEERISRLKKGANSK